MSNLVGMKRVEFQKGKIPKAKTHTHDVNEHVYICQHSVSDNGRIDQNELDSPQVYGVLYRLFACDCCIGILPVNDYYYHLQIDR